MSGLAEALAPRGIRRGPQNSEQSMWIVRRLSFGLLPRRGEHCNVLLLTW